MQVGIRGTVTIAALLVCAQPVHASAQSPDPPVEQQTPGSGTIDDPYPRRPQCAAMFLKADWQLTTKQRACDWIHNRMLSMTALTGAAGAAGFSHLRNAESERGDSFQTRFGRRFAQSAFKSTGSYLGGWVFHEDPRERPPYLVMRREPHPHGFFKRTTYALGRNFISYRCDAARGILRGTADCTRPEHIKKVPAISRIAGSFASGAASELWDSNGHPSRHRVLRGVASAYAATFVNTLVSEFKPELSAFGNKMFRAVFGGR